MEHKNTCKAVIYQRDFNHVLMLEKRFPDGRFHYTLPGGVTDPGETLIRALERECLEEINCIPEVGRLLYVCEFDKPAGKGKSKNRRLEFGFLCTVPDGYLPQMGPIPDAYQTAVRWVEVDKLDTLSLIPTGIEKILGQRADVSAIYLGLCPYIRSEFIK